MEGHRKESLKRYYNFNRRSRYEKELKRLDKRFTFVWNKLVNQWAIFQSNKLIGLYDHEREGLKHIKAIYNFHKTTENPEAKMAQQEKDVIAEKEKHRKDFISDAATEASERSLVNMYGNTPMVKLGG